MAVLPVRNLADDSMKFVADGLIQIRKELHVIIL
jgi:hypothetical protein